MPNTPLPQNYTTEDLKAALKEQGVDSIDALVNKLMDTPMPQGHGGTLLMVGADHGIIVHLG
jgi:hypothetical protein